MYKGNYISNNKVTFVSPKSLQSAAFAEVICSKLDLHLADPLDIKNETTPMIVLVDLSSEPEALMALKSEIEKYPALCRVVLINIDPSEEFSAFLSWPSVVGIFNPSDTVDALVQGIAQILKGELWVSRHLSSRLIHHFRGHTQRKQLVVNELTIRQDQILKMLASGNSNSEIAKALSISPLTAKTHIYNLYKKINVKNRAQAAEWAKMYLSDLNK